MCFGSAINAQKAKCKVPIKKTDFHIVTAFVKMFKQNVIL